MKSIILHDEEMRSLLETGRVTIRRAVKPQPDQDYGCEGTHNGLIWDGKPYDFGPAFYGNADELIQYCPYQPGVLWVKETWRIVGWVPEDGEFIVEYEDGKQSDLIFMDSKIDPNGEISTKYFIECTEDMDRAGIPVVDEYYQLEDDQPIPTRWRPSIHMPRWASRADVLVGDVRVEQGVEWDWVIELEKE